MSWFAVGAAVASAVISQRNKNQTAKKQDKAAAAGIFEQARLQREANARTNEELAKLENSTPQDEIAGRSGQIRDQLRRKQQLAMAGIQNTGGGGAVTGMAANAKTQARGYGDNINEWLSGMAGPVLQRQGEAFDRADTDSSLNRIKRDSAQQDYLTRLRIQGIRPSPLLDMLSTGLSAYSGAKGFGGGSTTGGGSGIAALGGQTPQTFYSNAPASLPGMTAPLQGNPYGVGSIFGNGRIGS
jgi:hypothetical protein